MTISGRGIFLVPLSPSIRNRRDVAGNLLRVRLHGREVGSTMKPAK